MAPLKNTLPIEIKKVWYETSLISAFFWLIINFILLAVVLVLNWPFWIFGLTLLLFFIGSGFDLWLIAYRYRFYSYQINPEHVIIQSGFIFRKRTLIPITRIQHVLIEQGPLLRRQNLVKLSIVTAADKHRIEAVRADESAQLQAHIMALVQVAKDDL